jgi:hypothetical protein
VSATIRALVWTLLAALTIAGPGAGLARAETEAEIEKLELEFTDPLTTLPQLFIKDAYTPANFGTHVQTNQTLLRAIIPRVPPYSLLPFVQLIRPTFSLVTVPSSHGGSRTEFGDTQVFDLAVLPWPDPQSNVKLGLGPMFVFPTATSRSAGEGAWQAGPAVGGLYSGIPGLVMGFLFQNPISFAYTSSNRKPLSTIEFQPVLLVHLFKGWYLRSADATWLCGWRSRSMTSIPLSLGVGRIVVRPGMPPLNLYVSGQWTAYRQFSPIGPQTTVNFGITVAFPELEEW